jgi:HAD superfamily hydrolase (TIGR01509 family)
VVHDHERTPWPIRSVVFDLDGLMIDSEPIFAEAARRVLARRGLQIVPEILQKMLGMPGRQALPIFRDHYKLSESVEELATECRGHFYDVLGSSPPPLLPGVLELLERLEQAGTPKAIATSSRRVYVDRVLTPHRLLDRFSFILTSDDVEFGKPHPEIYRKAVARFGHDASEVLVLEDSPNGLRAAKGAGARCIVVPHALVPRADIVDADAILESLAEPRLLQILGF